MTLSATPIVTKIPKFGITPRQRDLLKFIKRYIAEHDLSPTLEEMRVGLELKSRSNIHYMLAGLAARGHIRQLYARARSIEVVA